ncbi:CBS domain-containing protein [Streptomyces sp. NPDC093261]|uniref:CBS domain-containing protein n=1 Tax=Streptomyces sp. NPDC093261 TaxID=3366037 RepID=UPI0037FA0847
MGRETGLDERPRRLGRRAVAKRRRLDAMLHRRTVGDVMTEEVITLRTDTPFHEIASLLDANDIAAAPVIDDEGVPIGVVRRAAARDRHARSAGAGRE